MSEMDLQGRIEKTVADNAKDSASMVTDIYEKVKERRTEKHEDSVGVMLLKVQGNRLARRVFSRVRPVRFRV